MSTATCPDWTSLLAHRAAAGDDPDGWSEAVDHMDHCDGCRRTALAADPTLVFRRLPRPQTTAADVDAMRQAVASLRHANRVGALGPAAERGDELRPAEPEMAEDGSPLGRWGRRLRGIAAALLLTAIGFGAWYTGGGGDLNGVDEAALRPMGVAAAGSLLPPTTGSPGGDLDAGSTPSAEELATQPVFEGLSQPRAADVYQLGDEDFLVVMVVDETLDI